MNPTAIYSKSGKGVQEASGKTSLLKRPDRAVLSAIDGRATLAEVALKVGRPFDATFQGLIAQLDKDGFVREVSAGAAPAAPAPAAKAPPRPAAKQSAPAAPAGDFGDLDFSSIAPAKPAGAPSRPAAPTPPPPPSRPASPPPPPPPPPSAGPSGTALAKAREEAEARAAAERERLRAEAEAKTRGEMEAKLRAEAEKKLKDEAEAKAKADAEAKVKAAREAAVKAAAEAKARAEAEAKAKVDAERKAREEAERKAKEEAERVRRELEAERKAREEAERKAKEEAERARREAEEKARREAEELRQRLEEERKAREEAERKAKEEAERVRRELEEERKRLEAERKREEEERAARRKREEEEAEARRRQREEEERKAEEERAAKRRQREEEEAERERQEQAQREAERAAKKKQREEEEAEREREEQARREAEREAKRKQREAEEAAQAAQAAARPKAEAPKAAAKKDDFADSLLADLDSFTNRDEEERKAREESERKAKAEAEQRAREEAQREAERREREEAEGRRREEDERRRRDEEARRAREEEERRAQEDERRKREAEEIRRKAEAATVAARAKEGKGAEEDIPVTEDDLDMDEVKREQAAINKGKPKEPPPEKRRKPAMAEVPSKPRRPTKLGKPIAIAVVLLVVVGIGVAHVVPLGTADYERAATEALGRPVKIGSAKLWLFTGVQVRMEDVRVGDARIAHVKAWPSIGSLFGERKELSRVELDGLTLPQAAIGDAIFATVRGDNFRVEEIVVKSLELPGPATLPTGLQADMLLDAKGVMRRATVRGPDGLVAKLAPKDGSIDFEVVAAGFTVPIAPQLTLSNFVMNGNATPRGMAITDWGGTLYNGAISGKANIRWGGSWNVDGVLTVRGINAAVFAPTLLSAGSAEGTGRFSMTAADPSALIAGSRLDGTFTITKGTLGSFDLARAIQTNGKAAQGSTPFAEMNGQGTYERGAVALRNVTIGAGALNAGASADIAQNGSLSGRIVADVKTATQTLRATLLLGGTVKDPQVRN